MASTYFSVIALLALTCPFAAGDRDRQQHVVEVADRGHFRQSQQEANTDTAATGFYATMEGQTGDAGGSTAASTPGSPVKLLDQVTVKQDIATFQGEIEKANGDGWKLQTDDEALKQDVKEGEAADFQGNFKTLHTKLKKQAMDQLGKYETEQKFTGSYKNFAGEVMSLKPDRATQLVALAGNVEDSNFAANQASNAYTKHLEALSSNLASIHDLMGSEASYGYNQIKGEIDSGKFPFKSVTIVYPLRAIENGQTFNYNSTDFTPETRAYFDGPVLKDLKEQLSMYKDDYHFTFCLHASTNLGSQRFWGNRQTKNEYAHDLVEKRKKQLEEEVNKVLTKPDLAPFAGGAHVQAEWTKNLEDHDADTKHFASEVPFGVIMVLGDRKAGKSKDAEQDAERTDHAADVDKRRGCADSAKDMDELVTKKYPAGKVSYTYINGDDMLPFSTPGEKELSKDNEALIKSTLDGDGAVGNGKADIVAHANGVLDKVALYQGYIKNRDDRIAAGTNG